MILLSVTNRDMPIVKESHILLRTKKVKNNLLKRRNCL